ncbi:MAG TPA: hypothetical protein VNN08_11795, partial [Thermoanaerobaculia bacterium]|nr:hypothetical protein [Thermoanaerobaculia bacterium]
MANDSSEIRELRPEDVPHCSTPFIDGPAVLSVELETLPYHQLGGPGLERLCYALLLAKEYEPRFFGRSGQQQHGVDLVAEKAGRVEIFQCKNLGRRPTATELGAYLSSFEHAWLKQAGLPIPHRFVICCPAVFRDSEVDASWIRAKESFQSRTNIEVGLWDLDLLNGWLRTLPDVVADVFSDRHAEAFCDIDAWHAGLFQPTRCRTPADPRLKRYRHSVLSRRLYVDSGRMHAISDAIDRSPVIFVRGLPGTGKTFTTLAIAERYAEGTRRAYFVDVAADDFTGARLRDGIRARVSRPSIFVLENCHENPDAVSQALDGIASLLPTGRLKVICLLRRVPGPPESRSDEWFLESDIEAHRAVVDFDTDDDLLTRFILFWRPEFAGLSDTRLSTLSAVCGRDLFLLDELLTRLASPRDIDTLSPSGMYDMVRHAYFGKRTADDFPITRRLAALAQFGLYPRADVLRPPPEELALLESFCIRSGQPPRWRFLHSTAAELILHSLWSGMGALNPEDVSTYAASDIVDYFLDVQRQDLRPPAQLTSLALDLIAVLESGLKLSGETGHRRLTATLLDSEPVRRLLVSLVDHPLYPRLIYLCTRAAHQSGATFTDYYLQRVAEAIRTITAAPYTYGSRDIGHLGFMLQLLQTAAPVLHEALFVELNAVQLLDLIVTHGTIFDLYLITAHSSSSFARTLVDSLQDPYIDRLLSSTIASKRPIGRLHGVLKALQRQPALVSIARDLERKIGAERFLRLILANGTVYELFHVIPETSPDFAMNLLADLDDVRAVQLIEKSIASGRSIGTLHLTLRDLHRKPDTRAVGLALEMKIGAQRYLRLIESNGTFYELFRMLHRSSAGFAAELVEHLSEDRVERLLEKTISSGRSIGTLNLTLGDLRNRKETREIGCELERRIGEARFLRLIEANGTLFELFVLVSDATWAFGRELVRAIDTAYMERLVDRTIAAGRSIGTLNTALRDLHQNAASADIGVSLEAKLGGTLFWRLLAESGSAGPLADLLRDVSAAFRDQVVVAARGLTAARWQGIIARGDFFQLCKLIGGSQGLFDDDVVGPRLLQVIETQAPLLVGRTTWYERNTSAKLLRRSSALAPKTAATDALVALLLQIRIETLTFANVREALNGLECLYQHVPDAREALAAKVLVLLPAPETWVLNPREEMALPRILLRVIAEPEFSEHADYYEQSLLRRLTPDLISQSRTVDILWLLWGLFAYSLKRRPKATPTAFAGTLPTPIVSAVRDTLTARAARHGSVDEVRARFGLLGLLDLLGIQAAPDALGALRQQLRRDAEDGALRLCANQNFVIACLVFRAVTIVRRLSASVRQDFERRLLNDAEDYSALDPAAQYLYDDLRGH